MSNDAVLPILPPLTTPPANEADILRAVKDLYSAIQTYYSPMVQRIEGLIAYDVVANIPTAEGSRRFFYATDEDKLYLDIGTWELVTTATGAPAGETYYTAGVPGVGLPNAQQLAFGSGLAYSVVGSTLTLDVAGYTLKQKVYLTTGTAATYTRPDLVRALLVELIGGGGGGAGADGASSECAAGGGGGSGAYCAKLYTGPSATYLYTVGAGGTAGAAAGGDGGDGGATWFNSNTTHQAGGGGGGDGMNAGTTAATAAGGVGGSNGTNYGDLIVVGQNGPSGLRFDANIALSLGGANGPLGFGGGGSGTRGSAGNAATGYGAGGGGGASNSASDRAGAVGTPGLIVVWEFY